MTAPAALRPARELSVPLWDSTWRTGCALFTDDRTAGLEDVS